MKKLIVLLFMLAGLFTADVNAQSCCTPKKECKPAVCCPSTPTCCKDTKNVKASKATKVSSTKRKKSTPVRQPVRKKKKMVVASKVE